MSSVLKIVCSRIATPATHSSESPCFTNAAGPSRNSPLPIDAPSTITPGPTTPSQASPRGLGGAGSSARTQGSSPLPVSTLTRASLPRTLADYRFTPPISARRRMPTCSALGGRSAGCFAISCRISSASASGISTPRLRGSGAGVWRC